MVGLRWSSPWSKASRRWRSRTPRDSPPAVDPPKSGRGQNRLQRPRVVPPDYLSGIAVEQDQVLLRRGGPGELAGGQQVPRLPELLDVPHLGPRAPEVRRDGDVLFRPRDGILLQDRQVAHVRQDCAVASFDLGDAATQPDVRADL